MLPELQFHFTPQNCIVLSLGQLSTLGRIFTTGNPLCNLITPQQLSVQKHSSVNYITVGSNMYYIKLCTLIFSPIACYIRVTYYNPVYSQCTNSWQSLHFITMSLLSVYELRQNLRGLCVHQPRTPCQLALTKE